LLGFVIWPLLPSGHLDPWGLFYPREAWITVLVLAFSAILGGLVNSTATAAELSSTLPAAGLLDATVVAVLLTSAATLFGLLWPFSSLLGYW
jgi:uncharacterized membrane protein (DUF4010 family)